MKLTKVHRQAMSNQESVLIKDMSVDEAKKAWFYNRKSTSSLDEHYQDADGNSYDFAIYLGGCSASEYTEAELIDMIDMSDKNGEFKL